MVFEQAGVFAIFTLNGIIIGLLFDFFRIIRKSFKITDVGTYMQDISFWILTGIIFLYSMCRFCNGELRWYMVFGVLIGGGIYIITISRYIVSFSVKFVNISKKIFIIIFYPFNLYNRKVMKLSYYIKTLHINLQKQISRANKITEIFNFKYKT